MRIQSYLVSWDDYYENCLDIESQFTSAGHNISVINSGSPRHGWNNVGDIRYFRQLYYALKDFDYSNDYMLFMAGDVSSNNWKDIIERSVDVIEKYEDVYLYAPYFTNDPWGHDSTSLYQIVDDENLFISTNTNGIMFFMHKDLVKTALDFFNYFEEKYGWKGMISGWAVDLVFSSMAISENKLILRDKKYIIKHPSGSSYDHGKATEETAIIYQAFKDFGGEPVSKIVNKIYERMAHHKESMSVNYFYENINIEDYRVKIAYHTITINDERKENKDIIDNKLSKEKKLNLKSLNAKNQDEVDLFHAENPEFKFAWHSFKPGEFGNFGSHYIAWKYLKNSKLDSILIFEDDALLKDNFIDSYKIFMQNLPEDYDVFSIYIDKNQYPRYAPSDKINKYISTGYQDWSTLCYVVSRSGAEKMCKYVEEIGMDRPTDWFIFRGGQEGRFKVYSLNPDVEVPLSIDKRYQSQVQ